MVTVIVVPNSESVEGRRMSDYSVIPKGSGNFNVLFMLSGIFINSMLCTELMKCLRNV